MKKFFNSVYGKDIIALLIALSISLNFSLNLHGWNVAILVFLVGPLVAFIPRAAFLYYSQKSPKEGEKAMMVGMSVGYLFLGIGFAGGTNSADIFSALFSAAFYYIMLWSFTSYGFWGEKMEIIKPTKFTLILRVVLLISLFYAMFFSEDIPLQRGWHRYALVVIFVTGMARQIVLYFRPKYHIE
jgi:hypothetical protein